MPCSIFLSGFSSLPDSSGHQKPPLAPPDEAISYVGKRIVEVFSLPDTFSGPEFDKLRRLIERGEQPEWKDRQWEIAIKEVAHHFAPGLAPLSWEAFSAIADAFDAEAARLAADAPEQPKSDGQEVPLLERVLAILTPNQSKIMDYLLEAPNRRFHRACGDSWRWQHVWRRFHLMKQRRH